MKDLIIRGGYNVYPRDVEDVLLEHPAVSWRRWWAAPTTGSARRWSAFVSCTPGATVTSDELIDVRQTAAGRANKYPREVRIIDAIPLTSVGKLDRKRLRAAVQPS